jgi:NAD(P)-dependent dehydrogenase (short-subunit alcohol dehydrogenase family)
MSLNQPILSTTRIENMRVLIVGATGMIGKGVADTFAQAGHEVLGASRKGAVKVDIEDPDSIRAMYQRIGKVDAVVSCAGNVASASLSELTDEQIEYTIGSKLMGQVNLVRFGIDHVDDGGVFVLTAGIFGQRPIPGVPAPAMVNGALESFARAAARDLPRNIRIGTNSPPYITETAEQLGIPTEGTLSAADNARVYLAFVTGSETGAVIHPWRS